MDIFKILAFVILPVLIAAFFASIIPRKRIERQRFNEAADRFKETFVEEIRFLDRSYAFDRTLRDIPEVLAAASSKHEAALIKFMIVLNKNKRKEIKKAWKEYTGENKIMGEYTFNQYATYGNIKDAKSIRNNALNHLEKILSFAKQK